MNFFTFLPRQVGEEQPGQRVINAKDDWNIFHTFCPTFLCTLAAGEMLRSSPRGAFALLVHCSISLCFFIPLPCFLA